MLAAWSSGIDIEPTRAMIVCPALFGTDKTFSNIRDLHEAGAHFKSTKLSENHDYNDFLENYGDGATLMCVIDEDGSLQINQPFNHTRIFSQHWHEGLGDGRINVSNLLLQR